MNSKSTSDLVTSAWKKTNLAITNPFKYSIPTLFKSTPFENLQYKQNQIVTKEKVKVYLLTEDATLKWHELEKPTIAQHVHSYLKLSKIRLTGLVVLTTLTGSLMALQPLNSTLLAATLIGTGLTSASAAALNQFLEVPFDSQMSRTRNRPLVLGRLSSGHGFAFSVITGATGLTILGTMVNPLTMALGAGNLLLYSFIYTPMKRANILNTWIGSIVGAVPPIMGYTAMCNFIGN